MAKKKRDEALPAFVTEALLARVGGRGGGGGPPPSGEFSPDDIVTPLRHGGSQGPPAAVAPEEFVGASGGPPMEGGAPSEEFATRPAGMADQDRIVEALLAHGLLEGRVAEVVRSAQQATYKANQDWPGRSEAKGVLDRYRADPLAGTDAFQTGEPVLGTANIFADEHGISPEDAERVLAEDVSLDDVRGRTKFATNRGLSEDDAERVLAEEMTADEAGGHGSVEFGDLDSIDPGIEMEEGSLSVKESPLARRRRKRKQRDAMLKRSRGGKHGG